MDKTEFGYTAELPEKKTQPNIQKTSKALDPHEKEMMNRALSKIKLPREAWTAMAQDIRNGAGKATICKKYGIKTGYYKYIKKIMGFRS